MKFQASNVSIQREPLNFSLSSLHSMRESTTHDKKKNSWCAICISYSKLSMSRPQIRGQRSHAL